MSPEPWVAVVTICTGAHTVITANATIQIYDHGLATIDKSFINRPFKERIFSNSLLGGYLNGINRCFNVGEYIFCQD